MNSFRAHINKEIIEGIRTHRFLILAIGILAFSILDPVILKLTPMILKSQAGGIDITSMMDLSQTAAIKSYMNNLFQISSLVVALNIMGVISNELKEKTLVLPYSLGSKLHETVIAKNIVYTILVILFSVLGMTIAYYYSSILFEVDFNGLLEIIKAGVLYGLYFSFLISLVTFLSSIFKKPIVAGLLGLLIVYIMSPVAKLLDIVKYAPTSLLTEAKYLSSQHSFDLIISIISTVGLIILFTVATIERVKRIEIS